MGLKETAREISKKITTGELKPQQLGSHTLETFSQELISLGQTRPMFRTTKWRDRCNDLIIKLNNSKLDISKTRPLRWEMERIRAMR